MRRSFRHLIPLATLLAAGCDLYPEDPIFAYGQVLRADGTPVSGATLSFGRTLSLGDFTGRIVSPPDFTPHTTASSRADGAFTLELLSGDTYQRVRNGEYYELNAYRFRVDGAWMDDPAAEEYVENPHGSRNAVREIKP